MADKVAGQLHKFRPASELGPAEDYPIGSIEWAERISNRLQIGAESVNRHTVHHLWNTIKAIWTVKPHPWEVWPKDHPFKTPDDYCLAVTGHSWEFLANVVVEFSKDASDLNVEEMRAELAKAQAEHRPRGRHQPSTANKPLRNEGGDSPSKLLRRLARDHSDILARYERGEFKSVRAAAMAAGIVKTPTPFDQVQKLLGKMSDSDRRRVLRLLEQQLNPPQESDRSSQIAMFP